MKRKYLFLMLLLTAIGTYNTIQAQGFSTSATNWGLPAGGEYWNATNYSFRNIAYNGASGDDVGSQNWTVMDMNGDGKLDLVVFAEKQSTLTTVYSPTNNPYWKVYTGTTNGYNTTAVNWALPAGGEHWNGTNYSFRNIAYTAATGDDVGSQNWTVMDMNGDSKPDLVVYAEKQSTFTGVYSPGSNPYWKVYINTGTGFAATATNWALPAGGEYWNGTNYSFRNIAYNGATGDDVGSQNWTVMDMNGDSKPDLVVYAEKQSTFTGVYSPTSNPYWKVYMNSGSGFATSSTNWALPAGGEYWNGINYSFRNIAYNGATGDDVGSQNWTVMDMNGDSKLDLVVYAEKQATFTAVYSPGTNPYWKIYFNTGSGFSLAPTNWALPAGGEYWNGIHYSFRNIAYTAATGDDVGSQNWTVMDMNGDGKPDLVVFAEKQSTLTTVYSPGSNPYWKVYMNTGSGFATAPTNWALPAGGEYWNSTNYSFRNIAYNGASGDDVGSQNWTVMDMNADSKPDLVVFAEKQSTLTTVYSPNSNPYWKVYLNTGITAVAELTAEQNNVTLYPNPTGDKLLIKSNEAKTGQHYFINNSAGQVIAKGKLVHEINCIDVHGLAKGMYYVGFENKKLAPVRFVKK